MQTTIRVSGDAIAILMSDHQRLQTLFDQLLHGDRTTRPAVLERIRPLLVVHTALEENLIYPAIHEIAQRPLHAKSLYHEHDAAKVAFWELQLVDPGHAEFERRAVELREALLAHAREEEETELPYLSGVLTPAAMEKLGADVRAFREEFVRD